VSQETLFLQVLHDSLQTSQVDENVISKVTDFGLIEVIDLLKALVAHSVQLSGSPLHSLQAFEHCKH